MSSSPSPDPTWSERVAAARALTAADGPFAMEEVQVRGMRVRNYKRRASSLAKVFGEASERFADRQALVAGSERLGFAEVAERAESVAAGLQASGVRAGDRVGILGANSLGWVQAFWGCMLAGAISVPLNAWWRRQELAFALEHSDVSLLFVDGERWGRLRGLLPLELVVGLEEVPGLQSLDEFRDGSFRPPALDEDDVVSIFYTSGTTGRPKGAMVDHRGVVANLRNLAYLAVRSRVLAGEPRPEGPTAEHVALLVVPLFHVTGCHATLVASYAFGNRVVLYPSRSFDPVVAMELIDRERVTHLTTVPTLMLRMLDSEALGRFDLSSLRSVTYGGAPVPPNLPARTRSMLPDVRSVGNGYGLTETNAVVVANWGQEYLRKPEAIGRPVPVVDARVVGADGREMKTGQPGELIVRGPVLMTGYWRDEGATGEAVRDGWFHTGDIVVRDEEGDMILVDRAKDVIIRGGENVYSVEVENVLSDHPAVLEAAVIGVPDDTLGEEVKAVVVGEADLDPDQLRAWCAERLAYFKVPALFEVRTDPLPRNEAGKVLKSLLRAEDATA